MTFEMKTFEFKSSLKKTIAIPVSKVKSFSDSMKDGKKKECLEGQIGSLVGFSVVPSIWCGRDRGYVFDEDGEMKLILVFD